MWCKRRRREAGDGDTNWWDSRKIRREVKSQTVNGFSCTTQKDTER